MIGYIRRGLKPRASRNFFHSSQLASSIQDPRPSPGHPGLQIRGIHACKVSLGGSSPTSNRCRRPKSGGQQALDPGLPSKPPGRPNPWNASKPIKYHRFGTLSSKSCGGGTSLALLSSKSWISAFERRQPAGPPVLQFPGLARSSVANQSVSKPPSLDASTHENIRSLSQTSAAVASACK